jgi:hypothetical protein
MAIESNYGGLAGAGQAGGGGAPVDDLAPYRQSLVQNYGGLGGAGQAGGGGAPVIAKDISKDVSKDILKDAAIVSTYTDPNTGDIIALYSDGKTNILSKGTKGLESQKTADAATAGRQAERQSAYDLLYSQFAQYGLASLVEPLKGLIVSGASPAEFTIKLRESDAYQKRFAANKERVAKGLQAIDEATYIGLEDQYQKLMRNYGLPASYYTKDAMGTQPGFEKFIANDVSAVELEDRIATAQKRVINSNPEVSYALKQFYPDITNGDILAYTLDPTKGLEDIKRKVTSAEIGGAALRSGLTTSASDAEYLQKYGIDKATAERGYSTIGGGLQRGSELASIYGESPYTQTTAEQEVFNVPGAEEARKARQKITGLEKAAFGGQTGLTSGALARDRAGGY